MFTWPFVCQSAWIYRWNSGHTRDAVWECGMHRFFPVTTSVNHTMPGSASDSFRCPAEPNEDLAKTSLLYWANSTFNGILTGEYRWFNQLDQLVDLNEKVHGHFDLRTRSKADEEHGFERREWFTIIELVCKHDRNSATGNTTPPRRWDCDTRFCRDKRTDRHFRVIVDSSVSRANRATLWMSRGLNWEFSPSQKQSESRFHSLRFPTRPCRYLPAREACRVV